MATIFESETCTRCGGSGEYSSCERYGKRCFRCAGRKVTLTKRGEAARRYYQGLITRRAANLAVGDKVMIDSMTGSAWEQIVKVETDSAGLMEITSRDVRGLDCLQLGVPADRPYMVAPPAEDRARYLAMALTFQASLTRAGQPPKRSK
jgi:hypothetical protein